MAVTLDFIREDFGVHLPRLGSTYSANLLIRYHKSTPLIFSNIYKRMKAWQRLKTQYVVWCEGDEPQLSKSATRINITERLLESGDYSDVTISCYGVTFRIHRSILCSQSEYFRKAFDGDFKVRNHDLFIIPC